MSPATVLLGTTLTRTIKHTNKTKSTELDIFMHSYRFSVFALISAQVPNQRPRFVDNEYVTTFNEEQPIGIVCQFFVC